MSARPVEPRRRRGSGGSGMARGQRHAKQRDLVDPGEGDEHDHEREAAVEVRPGDGEQRDEPQAPRVLRALDEDQQRRGEQDDREQLRPKRERRRGHGEEANTISVAVREELAIAEPPARMEATDQADPQRGERQAEGQADERRPKDREARPARDLEDRRRGAPARPTAGRARACRRR